MGYQTRKKSPRGAVHGYNKPLREKRKDRKRLRRGIGESLFEEKHSATEKEVSEVTLKRLHTLGIQKFGSSPFSLHFDRWLINVESVVNEFESQPNIIVDEQFVNERSQTLSNIKLLLERITHKETALNQQISSLSETRNQLKQINAEYSTKIGSIKGRKNREIKRLNNIIKRMKTEQDQIIRMKTGFFRGISKNKREQKEQEIVHQLTNKQNELELLIMDFSVLQKEVRDEYERKRESVLKQLKFFQIIREDLETDSSLEERWFVCEALIDAVNSFMQRKVTKPSGLN